MLSLFSLAPPLASPIFPILILLTIFKRSELEISPSGNFLKVSFKVATSQMCNFPSSNFLSLPIAQAPSSEIVLAAALGTHCSMRLLRRPSIAFGKLPLGKLHIWEVTIWKLPFGSYHLGSYQFCPSIQELSQKRIFTTLPPVILNTIIEGIPLFTSLTVFGMNV